MSSTRSAPPTYRDRLVELVEQRIGVRLRLDITFDPIDALIRHRAHALAIAEPNACEAYVDQLAAAPLDDGEWIELVATVTNGQTAFYRDRTQLALVAAAMTELAAVRTRPLSIWCAGCSTGEEPYTIAAIARLAGVRCEIVATDIDRHALVTARAGRYSGWSLRRLADHERAGLVRDVGGDRFEVEADLRRRVTCIRHNLASDAYPVCAGGWDLVLCRNVLIYFESDPAQRVMSRLGEAIARDGWLFVGPADALRFRVDGLRAVHRAGATGFRRADAAAPIAPDAWAAGSGQRTAQVDSAPMVAANEHSVPFAAYSDIERLVADGHRASAAAQLRELLAREPEHVRAWITLGNLELAEHCYEAAMDAYGRAHALAPLLPELHFLVGVLHKKTGALADAAEAFRRALFLDPQFWPAASARVGLLFRAGDRDGGRRELARLGDALARGGDVAMLSCVTGLHGIVPTRDEATQLCTHYRSRLE